MNEWVGKRERAMRCDVNGSDAGRPGERRIVWQQGRTESFFKGLKKCKQLNSIFVIKARLLNIIHRLRHVANYVFGLGGKKLLILKGH